MTNIRYDIKFGPEVGQIELVPHFCREWEDGDGCYGTNPNHGMTLGEAKKYLAEQNLSLSINPDPEPGFSSDPDVDPELDSLIKQIEKQIDEQ